MEIRYLRPTPVADLWGVHNCYFMDHSTYDLFPWTERSSKKRGSNVQICSFFFVFAFKLYNFDKFSRKLRESTDLYTIFWNIIMRCWHVLLMQLNGAWFWLPRGRKCSKSSCRTYFMKRWNWNRPGSNLGSSRNWKGKEEEKDLQRAKRDWSKSVWSHERPRKLPEEFISRLVGVLSLFSRPCNAQARTIFPS